MRTGFILQGLLVTDTRLVFKSYLEKRQFTDVLAVIPLELIFLPLGYNPVFRFNRLLKANRWLRFEFKFGNRTDNPDAWRLVFLMHKLLLTAHVDACLFYLICRYEGFGVNAWVLPSPVANNATCDTCVDPDYGGVLRNYLAAMYWSTSLLLV